MRKRLPDPGHSQRPGAKKVQTNAPKPKGARKAVPISMKHTETKPRPRKPLVAPRKHPVKIASKPAGWFARFGAVSSTGAPWTIFDEGLRTAYFMLGMEHASSFPPALGVLGLTVFAGLMSRAVPIGPPAPQLRIGMLRATTTDALLLSQYLVHAIVSAATTLPQPWRIVALFITLVAVAALLSIEPAHAAGDDQKARR